MRSGNKDLRRFGSIPRGIPIGAKIYKLVLKFPEEERYGLTSQLKRAALSIPLNIAEGYGRKAREAEFKHFLRNSLGSSNEVIVLLKLVNDLGYGESEELIQSYDQLGKRIYRLMEKWATD